MAVKKAAVKKATAKKPAGKSKSKKADAYSCGVCGLAVTVDETCGCVEAHDIICCMKPMKRKKGK